jgi:hypothetical protein
MAIKLNHTIVHARDKRESAHFFAEVFGLPKPAPFGPFLDVEVANEVTLAFRSTDEEIQILEPATSAPSTQMAARRTGRFCSCRAGRADPIAAAAAAEQERRDRSPSRLMATDGVGVVIVCRK